MRRSYWLLLAIANFSIIWLAYSVGNTPGDFGAFYAAGQSAPAHIFDLHAGFLPYYHPPQELIIFKPLSWLSYDWARWVWRIASAVMLICSARILKFDWMQAFAFVPVVVCLVRGQDSILVLFLIALCLSFARQNKDILAGVFLALAMVKPQAPALLAVALLIYGRRKLFLSFAISGAAILMLTFSIFGNWIPEWLAAVRLSEPREMGYNMLSFHGLLSIVGVTTAWPSLLLSAIVFAIGIKQWRTAPLDHVFASAVIIGSLGAFHFHLQDASMLLVPIAIIPALVRPSIPLYASPLVVGLAVYSLTALLAFVSLWLLLRVVSVGTVSRASPAYPYGREWLEEPQSRMNRT